MATNAKIMAAQRRTAVLVDGTPMPIVLVAVRVGGRKRVDVELPAEAATAAAVAEAVNAQLACEAALVGLELAVTIPPGLHLPTGPPCPKPLEH